MGKSLEKHAPTADAFCQIRRGAWTHTEVERLQRVDRMGKIRAVVGGHEITIRFIASFGDVKLLNLFQRWYSLTPAIGKGMRATWQDEIDLGGAVQKKARGKRERFKRRKGPRRLFPGLFLLPNHWSGF